MSIIITWQTGGAARVAQKLAQSDLSTTVYNWTTNPSGPIVPFIPHYIMRFSGRRRRGFHRGLKLGSVAR